MLAAATWCCAAGTAFAHTGLEPHEAAPGTLIDLTLNVADERDDAGTVKVEFFMPTDIPIAVAAIPAANGWTGAPDVPLGEPATYITWTGPASSGDFSLPFTLGPLPDTMQRLQFKVLQTYDNGDLDRWIEEWPAGAPEPERPGPVLDLVAGGPGTTVVTTAPTTASTTTPSTSAPSTTEAPTTTTTGDGDEDDDSSNAALPIALGALALAGAGGGLAYAMHRKRSGNNQTPPDTSP
jgi:uncharacterized protein YcnI